MTEYKSTPRGILKLEIAFSEILSTDQACEVLNAFEQRNAKLQTALEGICKLITGHDKTSYYILNECRDLAKAATT